MSEISNKYSGSFDPKTGGLVTWNNQELRSFHISDGLPILIGNSKLEPNEMVNGMLLGNEFYATLQSQDSKVFVAVGNWKAENISFTPIRIGHLVSSKPSLNGRFCIANNQAIEVFDGTLHTPLLRIEQNCTSVTFDPVSSFFLMRQHDCTDLYLAGSIADHKIEFLPTLFHPGAECQHFDLRSGVAVFLALGRLSDYWSYAVCVLDLTGRQPNRCIPLIGEPISDKRIELVRLAPNLGHMLILCEFTLYYCSLETGELKKFEPLDNSATTWFDFVPNESLLVHVSSNGVVSTTPSDLAREVTQSQIPTSLDLKSDPDFCNMDVEELWTL